LARTLGERLVAARQALFVGREPEKKRFREMLSGAAAPGVLWLHSPGGVGKSALLRECAAMAREAKHPAVFIDGRHTEAAPLAFLEAVCAALNLPVSDGATRDSILDVVQQYLGVRTRRVVIFVDAFELLAPLETWFREEFLPSLPENVFLVLAGRRAPDAAWNADAGWRELVHVHALHNLDDSDAVDYLKRRRIPTTQHVAIMRFTHGHPLALSLVADFFEQGRPNGAEPPSLEFTPEDAPEVVHVLLDQLVEGELPTQRRAALEACALVRVTTEELLAALLDADAHELFLWLRGLPFIETGRQGLLPQGLEREVLLADLRWRNPGQLSISHDRARNFYSARFRKAEAPERQRILLDYVFLHRQNPTVRNFLDWRGIEALASAPLHDRDVDHLVAMVEEREGHEAAILARHWFAVQPQNVSVFCDHQGLIDGFMAQINLTQADAEDIQRDPATQAAWSYLESHAPLQPGEEATLLRFWMARDSYQDVSPVQSLVFIDALRHYLTAPHLAFTFFACAAPESYAPLFTYTGAKRLAEADFKIGGHEYGVYGHNWREVTPMQWLDSLGEREAMAAPHHDAAAAPPLDVLSRDEFFEALRAALRDWHNPQELRANPLLRTRLVVNRAGRNAGNEERVAALQSLIREAIDSLRGAKREGRFFQALYHGYLQQVPTQERAAEAMDVPLSTYRRHLKAGINAVFELLWYRETGE
jgi:hypothetical protein